MALALLGAGPTAAGGAAPIVLDTFTGADGTNNNGRAANTGQTWTMAAGSASLLGNKLKFPSFTSPLAIIDSGVADCTVQADIDFDHSDFTGIIFRWTDSSNYWFAAGSGPGATVYLKKIVAGSETDVTQLNPWPTATSPRTLVVVLAGSSITVKDGATTLLTATDSFNATATKHGLGISGTQFNDMTFDNFQVA